MVGYRIQIGFSHARAAEMHNFFYNITKFPLRACWQRTPVSNM